ncbi:MAG: hypothetical protein JO007_02840 [Alphaproteobacteria bacterium]|nr:hypothetical protein [Alphaproteobacteria bacterium]
MLPFSRSGFVTNCALAAACTLQMAVQELGQTQAPTTAPIANPEISAMMTCSELKELLRSDKRSAGLAILWFDGYYSGRAGLKALPAGWVRTMSQGLGGTCAIDVNASRPVLDVIAKLHHDYGG